MKNLINLLKDVFLYKVEFVRENPFLASLISFTKGVVFTIIAMLLLCSCSPRMYNFPKDVTHVLAVNSQGDTVKVPIENIRQQIRSPYYNNWQFNYNDNWIPYSQWYSPFYTTPFFNWRYYNNPRPIIVPKPQPRYIPRHFDNRPNPPIRQEIPNRGRSNVQPPMRQPQQPPRVQQPRQPQQPPRVQVPKQQPPQRPQTRGGVDIKQ